MLATAILMDTPHEGKHTAAHIWKKMWLGHPECIKPAQAVENKDRRVDWLTYKNIIDWNARDKIFLIDVGMGKDELGVIHVCLLLCFIMFLTQYNVRSYVSLITFWENRQNICWLPNQEIYITGTAPCSTGTVIYLCHFW